MDEERFFVSHSFTVGTPISNRNNLISSMTSLIFLSCCSNFGY